MTVSGNIFKDTVRRWILLRMAASEFYFKQPFDIKEEYPIITSVLGFALMPIFMIFVFWYARVYGSLASKSLPLFIMMFVLCFGIAFFVINNMKDAPFINQTIKEYESMNLKTRKACYSLKNGFKAVFIMGLLPWMLFGISIVVICYAVPLE